MRAKLLFVLLFSFIAPVLATAEGRLLVEETFLSVDIKGQAHEAERRERVAARSYLRTAREFARRGWLAVVVVRRGFGRSEGKQPYVLRGCRNGDYATLDDQADDLEAAIQAIGRRVIGIDISAAMLEKARKAVVAAGVDVELREGDMRELELDEPAALIYSPFRSLLHVPTWHDRRQVFERIAASLLPGGRFAWNVFAFDHAIAARLDGQRQEKPVPHLLRYSVGESRTDIILDSGDSTSLWWSTKNEWLGLIDVAGLEVEALYGSFDRAPFDDESREFVWVARKPT